MKKAASLLLTLIMVLSVGMTVFAAPGKFVVSPSTKHPELVEAIPEEGEESCPGKVVVIPYSERENMPDEAEDEVEEAYNDIVKANKLTDLNEELKKLADDKNVPVENLAVSDLFDVGIKGCTEHDGHGNFKIVLDADMLDKFVGLMRYINGKWEVVKNANVKNGKLNFTLDIDYYTPLAIVVGDEVSTTPPTGDDSPIMIYAVLAVVSALAVIILLKKSKKQKEE